MTPQIQSILMPYAMSMVGIPYLWGGKTPMSGLDCSGLVSILLVAAGLIGPHDDLNAQGIYDKLIKTSVQSDVPSFGTILFFGGDTESIHHIAFAIDSERMIEAGGGDSTTLTTTVAIEQKAYVKIDRIDRRQDLVAKLLPNYP